VKETILPKEERAVLAMRALYESFGYTKYKMSKFEDYDLYRDNKRFLPKGEIITFPNRDGRLLALKPDVTLSIVKNAREGEQIREYYNENVYRTEDGDCREIMQVGLECIGEIDLYSTCEVLRLAKKSLEIICEDSILDISHGAFKRSAGRCRSARGRKPGKVQCLHRREERPRAVCAVPGIRRGRRDRRTPVPSAFPVRSLHRHCRGSEGADHQ